MSDADTENQPEWTSEPDNPDVGRIITGLFVFVLIVILIELVVPTNVDGKSREMRAYSEIKNCDLALTKLLRDAQVSQLRDLFLDSTSLDGATDEETIKRHTDAIYDLLRNGKNASLDLRPGLRNRLFSTYMILSMDPWGEHPYVFYMPYGHGDESNALDRRFLDTYMTYTMLGGEKRPWQRDLPIFIACRGKDGRLELFESRSPTYNDVGDDFSNLRDPSAPGRIEFLEKPAPSR